MLTSSDPTPSPADTLPEALACWARRRGDRTALTYLDHRVTPLGAAATLTWRELDERVTTVASVLYGMSSPGDRAAILMAQGIEYVVAFLACLRAGLVAVPLFEPTMAARLGSVLADARPSLVLTTRDRFRAVRTFLDRDGRGPRQVIAVDGLAGAPVRHGVPVLPGRDDPAYLQYTSGSTQSPSGVVLTHGNVMASAAQAARAYGAEPDRAMAVSWLPLFHDMGLVLAVAAPVYAGMAAVLMDPMAFLEKPVRWLHALAASPGAISAAPSFAYGYTASRISPADKASLDLGGVRALINGSEPVRAEVMDRFHDVFAECGLKPETHRSSYGLAEATVLVSVTAPGAPPRRVRFDRARLGAGEAVLADADDPRASMLVSIGRPAGQEVVVVDPVRRTEVPPGKVGELWVSGPNVGQCYWRQPVRSCHTFGALLGGGPKSLRWLRTGDLGVRFDGELYLTGRIKDLVIVDGRNHYPQDVEATAERAHPAIRPHALAAFGVPGPDGERMVVAVEHARWVDDEWLDPGELTGNVRVAVAREHGVAPYEVVVLPPDGLPRTTSGKVTRAGCRARYLAGTFSPVGAR
ncbi:fatty acyl-AMP ligase [Amycolatopsis minnesotensis]|uniref:Fatty acyl-AMP ligase n=1 Tax=Amycolatopsis minnesotensis TaxID=337894 RepID=A0ABN2S8X5_9PSEU